jgi:cell division protease FtsH
MPTEDRYLLTVEELQDRPGDVGAAELIVFGTISTGASDDIQRATELARRMVTEFGMSEKLGSVRYAGRELRYLPGAPSDGAGLSPETQAAIDGEVQRIIEEQYERAQQLLLARRAVLEELATELLKRETVDGSFVREALASANGSPAGAGSPTAGAVTNVTDTR